MVSMPNTRGDHMRDLCPAASFSRYRPLYGRNAPSSARANTPSTLLYFSMAPAWDGDSKDWKTDINGLCVASGSLWSRQRATHQPLHAIYLSSNLFLEAMPCHQSATTCKRLQTFGLWLDVSHVGDRNQPNPHPFLRLLRLL